MISCHPTRQCTCAWDTIAHSKHWKVCHTTSHIPLTGRRLDGFQLILASPPRCAMVAVQVCRTAGRSSCSMVTIKQSNQTTEEGRYVLITHHRPRVGRIKVYLYAPCSLSWVSTCTDLLLLAFLLEHRSLQRSCSLPPPPPPAIPRSRQKQLASTKHTVQRWQRWWRQPTTSHPPRLGTLLSTGWKNAWALRTPSG